MTILPRRAWLFTSTSPAEIFGGYAAIKPGQDLVVAVDNGLERLHSLGIEPDIIIGDMDSCSAELLVRYSTTPLKQYPSAKNETDTELAVLWALEQGAGEIIICNGLEGRFDHSLALLQNLAYLRQQGVEARIESATQRVFFLAAETVLNGLEGCLLTLLAWEGDAEFEDAQGLLYPLEGLQLSHLQTRGLSNRIESDTASIRLHSGKILAVLTK